MYGMNNIDFGNILQEENNLFEVNVNRTRV